MAAPDPCVDPVTRVRPALLAAEQPLNSRRCIIHIDYLVVLTILYKYQFRRAFARQEERLVTSVSQAPGSHVLRIRRHGLATALQRALERYAFESEVLECDGADLGKAGRSRA
ncbi:hypothetical protein BQ8794_110169 [Mesorhizobium prunaredense]|uniref:Uncharacterized protein n=1 Tax=Mesorhizobium prunaredense TaxID=1631249 RepID=A0A1R3V4P7_9HYPH|nr:hypothetical protein BQ8794_110169 [Mesorhizobium prunaredense]